MSDDYNEYNANISKATMPTKEEFRLMSMTQGEREEEINRLEYASAKAAYDTKEADIQRRAAEATRVALAGNQWLQMAERGQLNQRVTVQGGKTTVEQLNRRVDATIGNFTAPQALIDTIPVTIGGIQLGPQQAKEMLQRGEISERDYYAGVDAALVPYGYGNQRSFR